MKLNTKPLNLEYRNKKLFLDKIEIRPTTRKLIDMKDVLMDPSFINKKNQNEILYLMYRDLKRKEDKVLFRKYEVRYDITIIFSKYLGKEFNKTFGHLHPIAENNLTYPEVYEVLYGKALFILQKYEKKKVKDVLLIYAKKGDKILIPPNYGHVTVNIGKRDLILSNLVSNKFSSIYELYKNKNGAAIYIIRNGKKIQIVKNKKYTEKFKIKIIKKIKFFKFFKENLYSSFINYPQFFKFLNKPSLIINLHY
ncbi:MAG: glucose-6-phosphate isomerase family protein [Candidatus Aenigmatarchaeota archaeon]